MTHPISPSSEIRLLDSHTVNQIAAGEVIERPAAAVKELVENALDAGASSIEVILEEAGRRLISVADDGIGMTPRMAKLALDRHATSKIRSANDLQRVASLGFRGEALPSIASVAHMTMETATEDGARTKITIDCGNASEPESIAGARGTRITVRDLFLNIPARLKFLKSDTTEIAAAVDVVSKLAVAFPDVAFRLKHNDHALVTTFGQGDFLSTIAEVWGRDSARGLVPIDHFDGQVRVQGYISPPHFTKPTRNLQWVFVNQRPIKNRTITAAIDQAYRSLTPERRYPLVMLMISVNPDSLDVNVSPTKSEVKFHHDGAIFDAVRRGIKEALMKNGMVPSVDDLAVANAALQELRPTQTLSPLFQMPSLEQRYSQGAALDLVPNIEPSQSPLGEDTVEGGQATYADLADGLRILGQVDNTLILAENRTHILIVDQHVAHERILYEMLRDSRGSAPVEKQPLLTPETMHVDRRAVPLITQRIPELSAIGFDLEPFGSESFLVRSVPALSRGQAPISVLRDILDEIADGSNGGLVPTRDEVYIMCSCKMAIKAGDALGVPEMEKLLADLVRTENPYLCPHGRPITVVLPKTDLLRKFKR